jgi:hypothetical protein
MSYSDDVAEAEVRHMRSRIISRMKSLAFSAGNWLHLFVASAPQQQRLMV